MDELPVKINHAKEPLKGGAVGRCRKVRDGGDMLAEGGRARAGNEWPRYSIVEAAKVHFSRLMVRPWRQQRSNT